MKQTGAAAGAKGTGAEAHGNTGQGDGADQAKGLADRVKGQFGDLASQAKDQASQLADDAREQVTGLVAQRKDDAAERLDGFAEALRGSARKLTDQDAQSLGVYVEKAADQVDKVANYLREKELSEVVDDVEGFARRRPEVFLGGAFLAGVLAARFLKSSGERRSSLENYPKPGGRYQGAAAGGL
ncbi:MAG: hypothetical protein M3O15_12315 [Acidobacteriota bacterium]|nr:hypothetical protein [Acidobacteriota bacterium]